MPTCLKCNADFPNWLVINGKKRNLCSRKFCLSCSPFGKHNRRNLSEINSDGKVCSCCKRYKTFDKFYKPCGERKKVHSYCKQCQKEKTISRFREFKILCVNYKGGKCINCGYNKCYSALEFHHRNSIEKDFNISKVKNRTFNHVIKTELDKCDLVCANCHRECHEYLSSSSSGLGC